MKKLVITALAILFSTSLVLAAVDDLGEKMPEGKQAFEEAVEEIFQKYIEAGRVAEFRMEIDQLLHETQMFPIAYYFRARADILLDETDKAMADINEFMERSPMLKGYLIRSSLLYDNQNYQEAAVESSIVLTIDNSVQEYYWRGLAYYFTGRFDFARKDFEKHLELGAKSKNGAANYFLGLDYYRNLDYKKAEKHFNLASEMDNGSDYALLRKAELNYLSGGEKYAQNNLEKFMEPKPGDTHRLYQAGIVAMLAGDYETAIHYLLQGVDSDKGDSQPYCLLNLAALKYAAGNKSEIPALVSSHADLLENAKKKWIPLVLDYYQGKMKESDLLSKASTWTLKDKDAQCETYFYMALKKEADGDEKGASKLYEKALETGAYDMIEYEKAHFAFRRLNPRDDREYYEPYNTTETLAFWKLKNKKGEALAKALKDLHKKSGKKVSNLMEKMLRHESADVRLEAACAMASYDDPRALPVIIGLFFDEPWKEEGKYKPLEKALTAYGEKGVQALATAIGSCSYLTWAKKALENTDKKNLSAFKKMLHHHEPEVVKAVLKAIRAKKDPAMIQPLIQLMSSKDLEVVRKEAAITLGYIGDEGILFTMIQALQDESPAVREGVADALERLTKQSFGTDYNKWIEWFNNR